MIRTQKSKARLFFTYLKDKTELLLSVRAHGTSGSKVTHRRAPGDAAMNKRIKAILDYARIDLTETDIWILLYPPEIYTTTLYIPSHATSSEVRTLIHEQIFSSLSYPIHYDWENYHLTVHENGRKENMVTVTLLGKDVLPRIQELLGDSFKGVKFMGDALQFLNIESIFYRQLRGQNYEMILPYDEVYYTAAFRSGFHVESAALTHACSSSFGDYALSPQQVYLDIRQKENLAPQPKIQPVCSTREWAKAGLTPAGFPSWFIARNSIHQRMLVNFIKPSSLSKNSAHSKGSGQDVKALHLLD